MSKFQIDQDDESRVIPVFLGQDDDPVFLGQDDDESPVIPASLLTEPTEELLLWLSPEKADVDVPSQFPDRESYVLNECARLLEDGARLDMPDKYGRTPLLLAAGTCYSKVVELLCDHHVDVNAKDDLGFTAIQYAVTNCSSEAVRALFREGAIPNHACNQGYTALRYGLEYLESESATISEIEKARITTNLQEIINHGADYTNDLIDISSRLQLNLRFINHHHQEEAMSFFEALAGNDTDAASGVINLLQRKKHGGILTLDNEVREFFKLLDARFLSTLLLSLDGVSELDVTKNSGDKELLRSFSARPIQRLVAPHHATLEVIRTSAREVFCGDSQNLVLLEAKEATKVYAGVCQRLKEVLCPKAEEVVIFRSPVRELVCPDVKKVNALESGLEVIECSSAAQIKVSPGKSYVWRLPKDRGNVDLEGFLQNSNTAAISGLDLGQNLVDNDCAELLARAIVQKPHLTKLIIRNIAPGAFKILADALKVNTTVTDLELGFNPKTSFSPVETKALSDLIESGKRITTKSDRESVESAAPGSRVAAAAALPASFSRDLGGVSLSS